MRSFHYTRFFFASALLAIACSSARWSAGLRRIPPQDLSGRVQALAEQGHVDHGGLGSGHGVAAQDGHDVLGRAFRQPRA